MGILEKVFFVGEMLIYFVELYVYIGRIWISEKYNSMYWIIYVVLIKRDEYLFL